MSTLQIDRLKSSRTDAGTENSTQTPRKPRVVGTSDTDGVSIDLRATPGYAHTELTTDEVRDQ